jgi:general secretion pathway protein G
MLETPKISWKKKLVLRRSTGDSKIIVCPNTDHPITPLPDHPMQEGFTLIEMIIVITIVAILTAIAIPAYRMHVLHSREAVLKEDLYSMRQCIDQYTQDKNKAPQNLDDLVSSGYLRAIPKDPFTNASDTWQPVSDDSIMQQGQTETGIVDVHSGSNMVGSDGTAYNTW